MKSKFTHTDSDVYQDINVGTRLCKRSFALDSRLIRLLNDVRRTVLEDSFLKTTASHIEFSYFSSMLAYLKRAFPFLTANTTLTYHKNFRLNFKYIVQYSYAQNPMKIVLCRSDLAYWLKTQCICYFHSVPCISVC